jgi:hypothetical protein
MGLNDDDFGSSLFVSRGPHCKVLTSFNSVSYQRRRNAAANRVFPRKFPI